MDDHSGALNAHFPQLIEALLAGAVVCPYRYPRLYRLLEDEEGKERVEAERILERVGRTLGEHDRFFFAIYNRQDDAATKAVEARIGGYLDDEELVHGFFELVRETLSEGQAPDVGDRFKFAPLLERITASQPHAERLQRLASKAQARARASAPDHARALERVVERLADRGYLHCTERQTGEYVVAGEFALFNEWWRFALEQEGYDAEEPDEAPEGPQQDRML